MLHKPNTHTGTLYLTLSIHHYSFFSFIPVNPQKKEEKKERKKRRSIHVLTFILTEAGRCNKQAQQPQ